MSKRIDISKFKKRSDLRSLLIVFAHLALVLVPVYIAAYFRSVLLWIACWFLFGFLMNGLLNLMHECAHYHVFLARRGSDVLGRWVLGPLALADFDGYRRRHWKHHTHFGIDGDTKDAYLVDIHGTKLITFFVRCLILSEAWRKIRHQITEKEEKTEESFNSFHWLGRAAGFQVLFWCSLLGIAGPLAGRPWLQGVRTAALAYVLVYVYGLASLTVFAATLRAVAEHQLSAGQSPTPRRGALRNFSCGPIAWLVFGAYGFAEHGTHHCEPSLPYYHLSEATMELAADDPEMAAKHHYLTALALLSRSRPLLASVDQPR
jgi:fatty acid desaturase